MASVNYVTSLLGSLDDSVKKSVKAAFEYALKFLSWGPVEDMETAVNLSGSYYQFTTSSIAAQEFSIEHKLGTIPYMAIQVMPLNVANAQFVAMSLSTRVADTKRIYFTSNSTSATGFLYIESA